MLRPEKAGKYETISADLQGDSKKAAEKNRKAIEELEKGNCEKAKHLVDEALIADINHAPWHNTLGKIHYQMNDYYLAAWEFEFALKTSPSTAEYHNNLGLSMKPLIVWTTPASSTRLRSSWPRKTISSSRTTLEYESERVKSIPRRVSYSNKSSSWIRVQNGKTGPDSSSPKA
jgi:tetratricopeptide (TPR) repeat protein